MKKLVLIGAIAGSLIACTNAGDSTEAKKDSLDSIASEKKEAIDSTAQERMERIDSTTEQKKAALDSLDSINKKDTSRMRD
jgi:outer membrane murein-binding lipoprotein Lpp